MMKAVLHFKWVNSYQPSKRWKVKEQLVLTTSHLHFTSHSSLSSSRNYNPYSTHHFCLLTAHEFGALPQSFQYWKLRNPPVKSPFRPISLTSCAVQSLERILADRLYYIAETNNLFSQFQVGFRKGRSCDDEITWIIQTIKDGFQQRPMKRSVLIFFNFNKAYDTVWREKLLLHMLDTGIPSTFIRWIWSFFNDRRARVQLFNVFSSSRRFTQGLPQVSVLAALIFLFYINNLASSLINDAVIAVFAHDVSILTTARKKEDAIAAAQSVVNSIVIWSQEWKWNLKNDKSNVCPFSTWSNNNTWNHIISTRTQKVCVNTTPRLLNVILDRNLTFNAHLKKLIALYSYYQSHHTYFLKLVLYHSKYGFSRSNPQQTWLCSSCMAALALQY